MMGGGMMGGGMMGGMMGTMAASAAGSVAGNLIARQMFGSGAQLPNEAPAEAPAAELYESDPCKQYFAGYSKCMEVQEANSCQWAWDMVGKCRNENNL
jgi:hypothetical protein